MFEELFMLLFSIFYVYALPRMGFGPGGGYWAGLGFGLFFFLEKFMSGMGCFC